MIQRFTLIFLFFVIAGQLRAQPNGDIAVADVGPVEYLTPGTHEFSIGGFVHNYGMMYFPYQAGWSLDGGPWQMHNATPILAAFQRRFAVTLPVTPSITINTPGQHVLKVVIKCASITDTNPSNDTLVKIIRVMNSLPPKNVLFEVLKFQNCAPCYPGDTAVNGQLVPKPYMNVARLYIASGEPLYNINGDTVDGKVHQLPGHPAYMYDRFRFPHNASQAVGAIDVGGIRTIADTGLRVHYLEPVSVSFAQVSFDTISRHLSVTLKAELFDTLSGDYRFNLYVTEDSIYSWQAGTPTGSYWHNRVTRRMGGGAWGSLGSLPVTLLPGQTYSHTYHMDLASGYKLKHLRLIGLVQHKDAQDTGSYRILNSVGGPLLGLAQTSGIGLQEKAGALELYPNPAQGFLKVGWEHVAPLRFRMFDAGGRLLREWFDQGRQVVVPLADVPAGVYLLEVSDGVELRTGRFTKL